MKKLDLARFQKSRESTVHVGAWQFTVRRPSALDVARLGAEGGRISLEFACRFVVGWSGINEADLLPGGEPEPVEFSDDLFAAWIADQPDAWNAIVSGVIDAYQRHEAAQAERGNV